MPERDRAARTCAPGLRPRAARARSRPTTRSAASGSCRPTAGIRRSASRTSSWSPSGIREVRAALDRRRGRHRARGRHDHLRHRLPGHRHAGRPTGARPRRPAAGRRVAGQPAARTSARRSPASPTCSCCSGPNTGPGPQLDGLHDRVPDRPRDGRAARDARARRGDRRGHGPRRRRRYNRERRRADGGHGLEHRLRELVPRRAPAATPTLWPDWTWRFRPRTPPLRPGASTRSQRRPAERVAVAA